MADHGHEEGGGIKIPKFLLVGLGIVGLLILAEHVGIPAAARITCVTLSTGCGVPGELAVMNAGVGGPRRNAPFTPMGRNAESRPGHVGKMLNFGCPAGVSKGYVFVCDGPTGKCICR